MSNCNAWDELIRNIRRQYWLPWDGIHGISHWARVRETGLRLAAPNGASPVVVELFAVFHDACWRSDGRDPEHGRRGAELAAALRGTLIHLPDTEFSLLQTACTDHTKGLVKADITIQTCWDADRLDLARVGIVPDPAQLCTYYAARNNGYTVPRAAPFAEKALALAPDVTQGLGPPRGPYREVRTAAPRRALPRTVRSGLECRLFYAPHSMQPGTPT